MEATKTVISLEERLELLSGDATRRYEVNPSAAETKAAMEELAGHRRVMEATRELRKRMRAREESREAAIDRADAAEARIRELASDLRAREQAEALLRNPPPQSIEAERAVLCSILVDEKCLPFVRTILTPDSFYQSTCAATFAAMCAVADRKEPVDAVTIHQELRRTNKLEDAGGPVAIGSLLDSVSTERNAFYYAKIVREKWALRGLIRELAQAQREVFAGRDQAFDLIEQVWGRLQGFFATLNRPAED